MVASGGCVGVVEKEGGHLSQLFLVVVTDRFAPISMQIVGQLSWGDLNSL